MFVYFIRTKSYDAIESIQQPIQYFNADRFIYPKVFILKIYSESTA